MRFRNGILTMLALNALVSLGQSNLSFKKVKLVEKDGRVENALLDFVSDRKLIAILDSHQTAIDIPYNKIARISYGRTEHNQTGKMVALGAMSYGLGALLVPKAVQYHLFIDYDEQGSPRQVELIASDSDFERIRRIAGMETGKEIVAEGGVAPAAAAAAGPSSPTAGTAQPAASALPAAGPAPAVRWNSASQSGTRFALTITAMGSWYDLPSQSICTCPSWAPRRTPEKFRRSSTGSVVRIFAFCPAKRAKSRSRRNGRSMPGELTSSR